MHPLAEFTDGVGVQIRDFEIVDAAGATVQLDRNDGQQFVARVGDDAGPI